MKYLAAVLTAALLVFVAAISVFGFSPGQLPQSGAIFQVPSGNFALNVTQGSNGTISPGTTFVIPGGSQQFTIAPNTGYTLKSVTVDGAPADVISPWTDLGHQGDSFVRAIVYLGNGVVVAGGTDTMVRSTNYGQTWTNLGQQGGSGYTVLNLTYAGNSAGNDIVLAGVSNGGVGKILRSTNGGQTWSDLGQQFGESHVYGMISLGAGKVLAGTKPDGYILKSTDYGATWTNMGQLGSETNVGSFGKTSGGALLAGVQYNGNIWRSTDDGDTWTNLGNQFGELDIDSIVSIGNGVALVATYPHAKLLRTLDDGLTWQDLGRMDPGTYISNVAGINETGIALVGSGSDGHIHITGDYGDTWIDLGIQAGGTETNIRPSYLENGIFLAGTGGTGSIGKILRSTLYGLGPTTTYTFTNVQQDHSITAAYLSGAAAPDTTAPSVPTNLSGAAVSQTQINLTWTASTDNVSVAGYHVFRDGTQIASTFTNIYSDTGLNPSTEYTYTVSAFDAVGNESSPSTSAVISTIAPDTTPPSVPSSLSATAISATEIDLTWSASTDNVAVTGYNVYRCTGSCTPTVLLGPSASTSFNDNTAAQSTQYTYAVTAYDAAANESNKSSTATATTGSSGGTTRNVTCSGDITSAVASAINASATGDTVAIGAGSCSVSARLYMNDKNITLKGAGKGITNITTTTTGIFVTVNVSGSNNPNFRISSFSLSGGGDPGVLIQVWGTHSPTFRGTFRIDNISMYYPTNGADGMIQIWGPLYGLIDHNDFTQSHEATILTSLELDTENCSYNVGGTCTLSTLQGGTSAALPYEPGSGKNLYIENNTFVGLGPIGTSPIDTAYAGGRLVFRYNTVTDGFLYAHWTAGRSVNSEWLEVYNNRFTYTKGSGMYPARLQGGGTGIIHDNTFIGYSSNYILIGDGRIPSQGQTGPPEYFCDGTMSIDGNAGDPAAPGWPCLVQTGRDAGKSIAQIMAGNKEASFPMYLWNNGPQDKCSNPSASGAACDNSFGVGVYGSEGAYFKSTPHTVTGGGYGQGDVDWSKTASQPSGAGTHTLTYTPYTYPYPILSNGFPNPNL